MAAVDQIDFSKVRTADSDAAIRDTVRALIWLWIVEHYEDRISLRIWIFSKQFRIKELERVFEIILGPRPDFSTP